MTSLRVLRCQNETRSVSTCEWASGIASQQQSQKRLSARPTGRQLQHLVLNNVHELTPETCHLIDYQADAMLGLCTQTSADIIFALEEANENDGRKRALPNLLSWNSRKHRHILKWKDLDVIFTHLQAHKQNG